ncbi:diguanylate cyclase [Nannocystaceae bacterium ST9]
MNSPNPPPGSRPHREHGFKTTAPNLGATMPDTEGLKAPAEVHAACLVVIRGPKVGEKFDLDREITVGREITTDICLPDDGLVSRTHARFSPDAAGVRLADLRSTNGTLVNDKPIDGKYLDDGDQITIGKTVFKFISSSNIEAAYHDHVWSLTHHDGLTGVHNRPSFDAGIAEAVARATRQQSPLALLLFDIDHFKRCNDTHGHRAGDHVLRCVANLAAQHTRKGDLLARYGGEEFAVIVHDLAWPGPAKLAEQLRALIDAATIEFEGNAIPVTVSIGVAMWEPALRSAAQLVELADQRLYRAKHAGRNLVIAS